MRLHVGAEDGIDASLISALLPEPGQQVGIPMTPFKIGNELAGKDRKLMRARDLLKRPALRQCVLQQRIVIEHKHRPGMFP
jgi:hypothetical protein